LKNHTDQKQSVNVSIATIQTHPNILWLQALLCSLWSGPLIICLPEFMRRPSKMRSLLSKSPSAPINRIHSNYETKSTNVLGIRPFDLTHSNQHSPQTQTYAQVTSNIPVINTSPSITETHPPDLNKLTTSFLDKFKTLINPLIALLTKVISKLLEK